MATLPLSSWCCCLCHNGVVAIINAQAYLLLSQWCCPNCAGAIANIAQALLALLHQHCHPYCAGLFPLMLHGRCQIVSLVSLPLSSWRVCAFSWCCCPCHAGIVALRTLALVPLLRRPLCPCCSSVVQLIHRHLCPHELACTKPWTTW
jgi:hypothetical protein